MSVVYQEEYARKLHAKEIHYRRFQRNKIFIKAILDFVPRGSGILDMATGMGEIPIQLAKLGYVSWAIDINEANNARFRSQLSSGVTFLEGDILNYPFARTFQAIILKDILEHFSLLGVQQILTRVDGLLNKRGILVVGCPVRTPASFCLRKWYTFWWPGYAAVDDTGDETHQQWFTESFLKRQLKILPDYTLLQVRYLLYGINNFPRFLMFPLHVLQRILHTRVLPRSLSLFLQRMFGFRIMLVLRKP